MKVETSFYLIWSFFLFIFACLQFFQGFFPITFVPTLGSDSQKIGADLLEPENNIKSANNGNYYNRSILMIIDALRYDFVEKMPFTWSLLQVDDQAKACMVKLKVHPPTVTMPKIKTIISGTVPSFFDVILNLNSVTRLKANNKKIVFYGDNVWTKLFPGNDFFMRKGENFDSFFVNDFYEGDKNITNAIKSELLQADWDFMILHFLGLDHIGHVLGAQNPTIDEKLLEMDEIIKEIYLKFISNQQNLIFITGDHGMRDAGGHGGSSQDETQVPLIVLGIHCEINEDFYDQTDLATTASILLGLKVPETSNGALIPELLNDFSDNEKLFALNYTSNKLIEKIESQFGVETMKEKEFYLQLTEAHSYHQKYLDLRDPSSFMHSILKYTTSSQEMRSLLTANTVKYDMTSISISTLLAFSIWFKVLIVILNEKEFIEMNFNGKRFGVSLFISIIILKLVVFDVSSVTWSHFFCLLVSIWIITLNVWYLVNEFNLQRISKSNEIRKKQNYSELKGKLMSSEVESAIPTSTLPEVVLAAEENGEVYDYGLNLISTMAAARENISENRSTIVISTQSTNSVVGNKMIDVRIINSGSNSEEEESNNSPSSVNINDSVGVISTHDIISTNSTENENTINSSSNDEIDESVPIINSNSSIEEVEEETVAVEDIDTDDDVILVVQPMETIELLGDDDDDESEADVQIVNSNQPIPKPLPAKPKLLPHLNQNQQNLQYHPTTTYNNTSNNNNSSNNTSMTLSFPSIPRLPEPQAGSSASTSGLSSIYLDDEPLGLIKDLLDDHFGQLDFDLPITANLQMAPEQSQVTSQSHNSFGKSPRELFVSHLSTEIAIQTEAEYKPHVVDMETQTDEEYNDDDGDGTQCPICYEPWEESGEHSLVSLKCGHLFGESCVKRWLNDQQVQQNKRFCPVCRTKAETKHIRPLYARRIVQIKYERLNELKAELANSKERAKKYETLYKRELGRQELLRTGMQMNGHRGGPSTSNLNVPPLITSNHPLSMQAQPPLSLQTNPSIHVTNGTIQQGVPQLNLPTTSRGPLNRNTRPYTHTIYPAPMVASRVTRVHRPDQILRMLFDDYPHDYSAPIPIQHSAINATDPRTNNN
uniref:CSON006523 protein n=1 Tax=Culicoides sonorensis TaxID=179676 RepID=A0A336M0F1_CULSO